MHGALQRPDLPAVSVTPFPNQAKVQVTEAEAFVKLSKQRPRLLLGNMTGVFLWRLLL